MSSPTSQHDRESSQDTVPEYWYRAAGPPEDVEDTEHYRPGGFHPVLLGDILDNRLKVVHKLGVGGQAVVWLCRDLKLERWLAVKMLMAEDSKEDCPDLKHCGLFRDGSLDDSELRHLALPLGHFWIDGPNGRNLCIVLPLLGPPISHAEGNRLWDYKRESDVAVLEDICFQLAQAMKAMHSKGLCHGDFRIDNIMFRLTDDIHDLGEEEIIQLLDPPEVRSVYKIPNKEHPDYASKEAHEDEAELEQHRNPRYDDFDYDSDFDGSEDMHFDERFDETLGPHVPKYLVLPTGLSFSRKAHHRYITTSIAVIDFGVSYIALDAAANNKKFTGIPAACAPPEEFLRTGPLGFPSDIWSLAVAIFHVIADTAPFSDVYGLKTMIVALEIYLGPLPLRYRQAWIDCLTIRDALRDSDTKRDTFGPDGQLLPVSTISGTQDSRSKKILEEWGVPLSSFEASLLKVLGYRRKNNDGEQVSGGRGRKYHDYHSTPARISALLDMLKKMLRWIPEDRLTIDEVLSHPWLNRDDDTTTFPRTELETRGRKLRREHGDEHGGKQEDKRASSPNSQVSHNDHKRAAFLGLSNPVSPSGPKSDGENGGEQPEFKKDSSKRDSSPSSQVSHDGHKRAASPGSSNPTRAAGSGSDGYMGDGKRGVKRAASPVSSTHSTTGGPKSVGLPSSDSAPTTTSEAQKGWMSNFVLPDTSLFRIIARLFRQFYES
ncbi:kinase-like domain-containing protein [Bombardia bombarda]|uniref:EKC/KEOPS complex subunit BUD32 n=1 Tax=Bombardia bombarda TaxID=252184 RepID=A0AA39X8Z8_9PEZI|nr:kinase-like domain-containing protein [Bombardia bombarda]